MTVHSSTRHRIGDFRERKVMGTHNSNCSTIHKAANDQPSPFEPVMRVGTGQEFIHQKQHWQLSGGEILGYFQTLNLRIEPRGASRERIEYADGGSHRER